ncbi:MAG TPA: LysM domain-containing protein [Candidatus Sulfotelmatobacter sp.]|nr:LysM domain-containing protein [Candidatus Sulfotelmatobacter sp.]
MTLPAPVPPPTGAAPTLARVLADLPGRSPDPLVCPFLRLDAGTGLVVPRPGVDEGHRCISAAVPYTPSSLQQEMVCLRAGHAACPRYTKGSAAVAVTLAGGPRTRLPASVRLAALAVLVIFVGALGFGLLRGTVGSPGPTPTPRPSGTGSIASRWDGLPKCPNGQACYLYTVKSGDTFIGIASYFGTTKAGLQALNPQITNPALIHKGEQIKVPPPP